MFVTPEACKYILFFAIIFGAGLQFGLHEYDTSHQQHRLPDLVKITTMNNHEERHESLERIEPDHILPPLQPPQKVFDVKTLKHTTNNPHKLDENNSKNEKFPARSRSTPIVKPIREEANPIQRESKNNKAPLGSDQSIKQGSIEGNFKNVQKSLKTDTSERNAEKRPSLKTTNKETRPITEDSTASLKLWWHQNEHKKSPISDFIKSGGKFPIVLLTAKRTDQLKETLDSLLNVRGVTREQIVVLQDGEYKPTADVVNGMSIKLVQNKGRTKLRGGAANDGAALICSHYKFSLGWAFEHFQNAPAIIIVEDDFFFSPDFLEYFESNAPILDYDDSTFVLSAWNDNGFKGKVHGKEALHRTIYFPGLGWLLTRKLWGELEPKWPKAHWDHFLRDKEQHKERESIYPEIPRTFHNGKKGTFMDLNTHNKYFRDIDYNTDKSFRWKTQPVPSFIHAVTNIYQEDILRKISQAHHLNDFSEWYTITKHEVVIWYDIPKVTRSVPQPFKPVGEFFGIWHEVERGDHHGLHEFDWHNHHVLLIDKDSPSYQQNCPKNTKKFTAASLKSGWNMFKKVKSNPKLLASLKPVGASKPDQSCHDVCQSQGLSCSKELFALTNTCEKLQAIFPCQACTESYGPDQPVYVDLAAPKSDLPGHCLVTSDPDESTCAAKHSSTKRLCPCI